MSVEMTRGETVDARALQLQDTMIKLVRAFDLHQPERTPCGEPVPVSEAHALMELSRRQALAQHELGARLRLQRKLTAGSCASSSRGDGYRATGTRATGGWQCSP